MSLSVTVFAGSALWHDMIDPRNEMWERRGGQGLGASRSSPPVGREAKKKRRRSRDEGKERKGALGRPVYVG